MMRHCLVLLLYCAISLALPVKWSIIETSTTELPPSVRDPAFVYDKLSNRLILFGGDATHSIGIHDRTYIFNLNTNSWSRLNTTTSPPSRFSMIYGIDDSNERLLVTVGSLLLIRYLRAGQNYEGLFQDVWQFSLITDTWSEVNAQGNYFLRRYITKRNSTKR